MKIFKSEIKKALSLAEILIALTVVGIIAAMTIPALHSQYVKLEKRKQELLIYNFYKTLTRINGDIIAKEGSLPNKTISVGNKNNDKYCLDLASKFNTKGEIKCSTSELNTFSYTSNTINWDGMKSSIRTNFTTTSNLKIAVTRSIPNNDNEEININPFLISFYPFLYYGQSSECATSYENALQKEQAYFNEGQQTNSGDNSDGQQTNSGDNSEGQQANSEDNSDGQQTNSGDNSADQNVSNDDLNALNSCTKAYKSQELLSIYNSKKTLTALNEYLNSINVNKIEGNNDNSDNVRFVLVGIDLKENDLKEDQWSNAKIIDSTLRDKSQTGYVFIFQIQPNGIVIPVGYVAHLKDNPDTTQTDTTQTDTTQTDTTQTDTTQTDTTQTDTTQTKDISKYLPLLTFDVKKVKFGKNNNAYNINKTQKTKIISSNLDYCQAIKVAGGLSSKLSQCAPVSVSSSENGPSIQVLFTPTQKALLSDITFKITTAQPSSSGDGNNTYDNPCIYEDCYIEPHKP